MKPMKEQEKDCNCTKPNSKDRKGNEWCNKCFKIYKLINSK